MTNIYQDRSADEITIADLARHIREGRRLRSEEAHRLLGCFNALVRNGFTTVGKGFAAIGRRIASSMETKAARMQKTGMFYE